MLLSVLKRKWGFKLALEVLELGLRMAVFELLAGCIGTVPSAGHAVGHANPHHQQVEGQVAREEAYRMLPGACHRRMMHVGGRT